MAISTTLKDVLDQQQVAFELIPHPHTGSSMETAQQAHVPGNRLAKAVIINLKKSVNPAESIKPA